MSETRCFVPCWSSQLASVPSRVSDGALLTPSKVGDALGRLWAGSPFFLDFPMLSVSLAQTELESTGVIDAVTSRAQGDGSYGWCLAAGLAATLDAQKDKLEVVPEFLFSGRCEAALGAAAAFFQKEWVGVASAAAAAAFLVSSRILLRDAGKSPGKFKGKTVKRIFELTGFLACDFEVMIHGTQAAALLSAARTYGFVMKIVMCAAAAVVALLGDFALVRVLTVLLGVYFYGALAVNRGDLLGLRTCPTFASAATWWAS